MTRRCARGVAAIALIVLGASAIAGAVEAPPPSAAASVVIANPAHAERANPVSAPAAPAVTQTVGVNAMDPARRSPVATAAFGSTLERLSRPDVAARLAALAA